MTNHEANGKGVRISITGTTDALFETHEDFVTDVLLEHCDSSGMTEFSTGGAFGIDSIAASVAWELFESCLRRLCAPKGKYYNKQTHRWVDEIEEVPGGYLKRNDALVRHADILIAFPRTPNEELRSGTWATIRRARRKGIPIHIHPLRR